MVQVEVKELANQLPTLLSALTQGAEVILTQANQPLARLVKIETLMPDRVPGSAAGLFTMSPDFDEPLDDFDQSYQ
jgi:antitoxin (DNA-binding transcriptional repressor) of toxin-antitoxin stability system